jgi:hypothetical protein
MIEADLPEEVDEAAQMVRGADWMKAGLPRFGCAAAEALWYLMRIRSIHARMIRVRKQGYYTSMAFASLYASGLSVADIAQVSNLSEGFADKLIPTTNGVVQKARLADLGDIFADLDELTQDRRLYCANRVWRGAAIYAHILDRRIRNGAVARQRLAAGDDLVSIAASLKIQRRDLVRVLSVKQDAAVAEKARFVTSIIDPSLIRQVATSPQTQA